MTTDIDDRIDAFWLWVEYNAAALQAAAFHAARERDTVPSPNSNLNRVVHGPLAPAVPSLRR